MEQTIYLAPALYDRPNFDVLATTAELALDGSRGAES